MLMRSRLAATHHLPPTSTLAKKQTTMLLRIDDLEIEDIQSPGHHLNADALMTINYISMMLSKSK